MAKKFKVNDRVRIVATGEFGTVKGRDVIPVDGTKKINVEYIVKVGDGFNNWKSFRKNELEAVKKETVEPRVYTKVYDVVDGFKITMYGKVSNINNIWETGRALNIGYAIYSPEDVYDEAFGVKLARKRSRTSPFCCMTSQFNGEFNAETVEAIMDVKANYIKNNFDKFINRAKK